MNIYTLVIMLLITTLFIITSYTLYNKKNIKEHIRSSSAPTYMYSRYGNPLDYVTENKFTITAKSDISDKDKKECDLLVKKEEKMKKMFENKIKKSKLSGNKKAQKEALQAQKRFEERINDSKKYCDGIGFQEEKNTKIKEAAAKAKAEAEAEAARKVAEAKAKAQAAEAARKAAAARRKTLLEEINAVVRRATSWFRW